MERSDRIAGRRLAVIALTAAVLVTAGCASIPTAGTGDIAFRLLWSGLSDLDLHVLDPAGDHLSFVRREAASGGRLDVDCNGSSDQVCERPIENVFWPEGAAPAGEYRVWVETMSILPAETPLQARLLVMEGERVVAERQIDLNANGDRLGPFAVSFSRDRGAGELLAIGDDQVPARPRSHLVVPE